MVTKDYGFEISWEFGNCNSYSQTYQSDRIYDNIQCCQPLGNYILLCQDSYGDGWNGGYIEIDGDKYCDDFTSGKRLSKEVTISSG